MQKFKSIYFKDYNDTSSFKISFTEDDEPLYKQISNLPSSKIRELLNVETYAQLAENSRTEGLSVSRYCIWYLLKRLGDSTVSKQLSLFEIDSKFVTFSSSKYSPFQSWYPYLEGYSQQFVSQIFDKYFTNKVNSIYDPFSGTGTTPFTAIEHGYTAYYSEVNPLLRYLTQVKSNIRTQNNTSRIIESIDNLIESFTDLQNDEILDPLLSKSYSDTFGKSEFFQKDTKDSLLRIKSLIRKLTITDKPIADLLNIAVIGNIIKCSNLKRQGDLRFKTKTELSKSVTPDINNEILQSLRSMRKDILEMAPLEKEPVLLTEDARNIGQITNIEFNGVVTSPPYLNGTNYFRNTKLELWFLDFLKTTNDLRKYRDLAVTSGINDVSSKKKNALVNKSLEPIISSLQQNAYDSRIPKMVNDYFVDMKIIFQGISKLLSPNSILAIDLGDSYYSNVHVPTDEILTNIFEDIGLILSEESILRKRTSKGGQDLKQVLLVYKKKEDKKTYSFSNRTSSIWEKDWNEFKIDQPHKMQPYAKRNWGDPLHSLCSYQGKLKPSLAYHLVKTFLKPGDTMLDPFVGVGTIPLEASKLGVRSFGFDISPTALTISIAKVSHLEHSQVKEEIEKLNAYIKSSSVKSSDLEEAQNFGFNKKLIEYYHPDTLKEIVLARNYFQSVNHNEPHIAYIMSCLLHVLHGNRPYALSRRSHGITPFAPTGEYIYKNLVEKTTEKALRSFPKYLPQNVEGQIYNQDATKTWPTAVANLDAIITSPPFFDSTRFYAANWLRLWFSGWDKNSFKAEPLNFVDELQKKDFSIYDNIFRQAKERLKKNGVFVLHLGKSKKCNMAEVLAEKAKNWFHVYDIFEENVSETESHGIKDRGGTLEHQYLVLT